MVYVGLEVSETIYMLFDIKQMNQNQATKSRCVLYERNHKRVTKGYMKKLIKNKCDCL